MTAAGRAGVQGRPATRSIRFRQEGSLRTTHPGDTSDIGDRPWVVAEQRVVAARWATRGKEIFDVSTCSVQE